MAVLRPVRELLRRLLGRGENEVAPKFRVIPVVISAFSITKTVLSLHGGVEFDPDDDDDDYDRFLPMMGELCERLEIPPLGLKDYQSLLDLWRRAVKTREDISPADVEYAEALRNRYNNWVYDFFPGFKRTLEPGNADLCFADVPGYASTPNEPPAAVSPVSRTHGTSVAPNDGVPASSKRGAKWPSGDVIANAVGMGVLGVGLLIRSPGFSQTFQLIAVAVAVFALATAGLLLVQFRRSPELLLTIYVVAVAWTTYFLIAKGFTGMRAGALACMLYGIATYRSICREIRP